MDPFAIVLFGGLAFFGGVIVLIGRFYPGSGLEQLGMRSAREISETREALEAEDLDQMVAARNARRRARGEIEASADEIELRVARELGEQARRRERYRSERTRRRWDTDEFEQLLAATNARRRARGLPERSPEQARRELGGPRGAGS